MNGIFFAIVLIAFLFAAVDELFGDGGAMEALSEAMVEQAGGAVELALGLVGVMTLFLGLMKVAEAGGMLRIIARFIRPLMTRLFPDVPPDHPAMGAMILNISANALGLGNAATPFGIRAMEELERLNPQPGTATNAMALFLAINTSSVTLLPTGVIAIRAAAGSDAPAAILPTTLVATFAATIAAVLAAKVYQRFSPAPTGDASPESGQREEVEPGYPFWIALPVYILLIGFIPLTVVYGSAIAPWIIPGLMIGFLAFGVAKRVPVYEVFVEGAKEGFQVALRIIPYLVAILVAVAMFRASGAMEVLVQSIGGWTGRVGLPAEALPMALLRPLSGSGAYGIMAAIIEDPAIGPDSYTGMLVSTLQGSTETTFYVLAVYFGAVQVRRIRHALATALTADVVAVIAAVAVCSFLFT